MKINRNSFLFFCTFFFSVWMVLAQSSGNTSQKNNSEISKQDTLLLYYKKNAKTFLQKKDTLAAIQSLRWVAIEQLKMGYLYESESTAVDALEHLTKLPKNPTTNEAKLGLYNNLGRVYRILENSKDALYYYNKALGLSTNSKDSLRIINNIANVYSDEKKYELALEKLKIAYQKAAAQKDKATINRALDNLGFVKSKLNNPEGLQNMLSALEARKVDNDTIGIYSSYNHLTEYYRENNALKKANYYSEKGYQLSKKIKSVSFTKNALANFLKAQNNPLTLEYINLTDSIAQAKLITDNKYAGIKFNYEAEQKKAKENELLKEKEKRKKQLYQFTGVFILITSIFLFIFFRSRHKKEKILQLYNTETRISKKVHDEVANDVYHVMTKLQTSIPIQEDILDDLEKIYTKTRDISKQNSAIDLTENFGETLNDLLLAYKNEIITVITKNSVTIDWDPVSENKKTTIYRILQELMTNMKKHSNATIVVVAFQQKSSKIIIDYSDNGDGCNLKKGNGLQNTENRIKTIGGTITFDSQVNNGFKSTIIV